MNEPFRGKQTPHYLLAGQRNIPPGVVQAVLMHALQLRRSCRDVFLLCDIQRHSIPEAALILGISRTSANRRLLQARRQMDEVIERLCGAIQPSLAWDETE
jgi:DNA-directed RNA polymerase specialized sigma24 family protein